jgi:hypothetical protein
MAANAANFADAVIATAPTPATSGLTLTVATGYGTRFSAASFNVAIGHHAIQSLVNGCALAQRQKVDACKQRALGQI